MSPDVWIPAFVPLVVILVGAVISVVRATRRDRRAGQRTVTETRMADRRTRVVHVRDNIPGAVSIWPVVPTAVAGQPVRQPLCDRADLGQPWPGRRALPRRPAPRARPVLAALPALRGKPLACWCRHEGEVRTPANACHGDVLVELWETYTDAELRALGGAS
jgi:hypothetical protein